MKKLKNGFFISLITSEGLISQETSTGKRSILPPNPFPVEKLIHTIEKISPNTGRTKALAILHCYGRQAIRIPTIESAKRLIRNELILKQYRAGKTYTELSQEFTISERWIRIIIHILIKQSLQI